MGQGFFESDDDYQARMSREANERTIEKSTGSAAKQGWLESDDDYSSRISLEANEGILRSLNGEEARQGWFESSSDYRARVDHEAHEATVGRYTDAEPKQGWFESKEDYQRRLRHEANEAYVSHLSGGDAKQGWFEGDSDYRRRVSLEARELRAERDFADSSTASSVTDSAGGGLGGCAILFAAIGFIFLLGGPKDFITTASPALACSLGWLTKERCAAPISTLAPGHYSRGGTDLPTPNRSEPYSPPYIGRPSFQCVGQLKWVQRAICSDISLAAQDREVAGLSQRLLLGEGAEEVRKINKKWLGEWESCGGSGSLTGCLSWVYKEWLKDLGNVSVAGQDRVPEDEPAPMAQSSDARVVTESIRKPTIQCVLADGRERSLDMESCESVGGVEYR